MDADGLHPITWQVANGGLEIRDRVRVVGTYLAVLNPASLAELRQEHAALTAAEQATGFDPAGNTDDFAVLRGLLGE